jgi:hypothetical protein
MISRRRAARPGCQRRLTAVIGVLLLAVLTNTAAASRGGRWPACGWGKTCGVAHISRGHRWSVSYRQRGQYQYDRGYAAGQSHGWRAGYDDGRYRRKYDRTPNVYLKGRSHNFKRGYGRGYADGYERGFRQGRWKRPTYGWWRRPIHDHRPH